MLKNKKYSLNLIILKFFLILAVSILAFLWIFQFLFFDSFYKEQKINDIEHVAKYVKKYQNDKDFNDKINSLALNKSVCITVDDNNFFSLYYSTYFGKGCLQNNDTTEYFKVAFMKSGKDEKQYTLDTSNGTTVVYALKLDNDRYAFINASVVPVSGITSLITKQLAVMTVFVFILSLLLSLFISKHISKPIKQINDEAKRFANGDFNVNFSKDSNILEINDLSNTLNYAKDELSKTEEYRRDLMANVSHDLKTPLTMIKAYAEMSMELHKDNPEKQEKDMKTIIEETDRLTVLVNDILTLSKTQNNMNEIEKEEMDLIEVVKEIINRYHVFNELEDYKFNFIHNTKKVIIEADRKKIEQVIYNLVNNAINYTGDDNTVTVKIDDNKDRILVEIIDTGKGINDDDLPYIWDKYYKNKKKHKRNLIGTGLGLSIVKNILELHEYKYGVNTKKGHGTTFYFEIPKENKD